MHMSWQTTGILYTISARFARFVGKQLGSALLDRTFFLRTA